MNEMTMLDINFIRNNPELVQNNATRRKKDISIARLLELDSLVRTTHKQLEELRAARNANAAALQSHADKSSIEAVSLIQKGKEMKTSIAEIEHTLSGSEAELNALLHSLPNMTHPDVPDGPDESGNEVIRTIGEPTQYDFQPKPHWELGEELNIIDNQRAAKVTGARFSYLKGAAALLEFALMHHAFSVLTNEDTLKQIAADSGLDVSPRPFIPVIPPVMIRPEVMQKMGRLEPREERYYIDSDDLYLIGSAEHTLGSMHMDEAFSEAELPLRYVGFSTAFRREAGSYGKDMKGILRVHQFDKLEMETFVSPEKGEAEQDFIVAIQEYLVRTLGLPYHVVLICTGDMGAPDARQIDIETWMPGQNRYRETHTSDYMADFQSRRLNIKIKRSGGTTEFASMNDATAVAGRTLIAVLENYQQKDGSIRIPTALQPFMFGMTEIRNAPTNR